MADTTDTDRIEHDLAETRARMDRRLDELGTKLAPNQLVNDALAQVSGGDGADFAETLIAKARANPLPAALAGIGIVWLLASSQNRRGTAPDLPTRLRSAEAGVVRLADEHPDVHASRIDDARGQVLGIARDSADTAHTYAQRIKEAMAATSEAVRETSLDLRRQASQALGSLRDRNGGGGGSSPFGSPIVIGAAAALIGIIAGALLPVSGQEEQALGSLAGRVRAKSRDLAQTVVDRGAQVAGDAIGAARESAQAHGLTADKPTGELLGDLKSGELLRHAKAAAQEVAAAGKDSLQAQLGGGG